MGFDEYIKRSQRLFNHFINIRLGNEKITGGVASNAFMDSKYRRFSDDIDVIVDDLSPYPGILSTIPELGYKIKTVNGKGYRIYFFVVPEEVPSRRMELKTFLEYFGKNPKIEANVVVPEFLAKKKMESLLWEKRGREIIKDIYDLLTANPLYSYFKRELSYNRIIFGYLYVVWKTDILKNGIVCVVYPPFLPERAEEIVSDKQIDYNSALNFIIYNEKSGFLKKLARALGIETSLSKEIVRGINLSEEDAKKVVETYIKNISLGREMLLDKIYKS